MAVKGFSFSDGSGVRVRGWGLRSSMSEVSAGARVKGQNAVHWSWRAFINVELVQIRDLLRRELEGIKEKKKGLLEIFQNGNERTALSSYAVLQSKYAVSSKEKIDLIQMIEKLRGELEDFNRNEEEDINYNKEEDNKSLIQTVVNVRKELDDMKETNE